MDKLLPCPMCGGEARLKKRKTCIVECSNCGVMTIQMTEDAAAVIWNRRTVKQEQEPVLVDHCEFTFPREEYRVTIWTKKYLPAGTKLFTHPPADAQQQEPVAFGMLYTKASDKLLSVKLPTQDVTGHDVPLFAYPPDAAQEIAELNHYNTQLVIASSNMQQEIERLKAYGADVAMQMAAKIGGLEAQLSAIKEHIVKLMGVVQLGNATAAEYAECVYGVAGTFDELLSTAQPQAQGGE